MALSKQERRLRIKRRIRKVVSGTPEIPRLSVFRSNKDIYAQVINDTEGKTLASASSLKLDMKGKNKTEQAFEVGKALAENAKQSGIEKVVFDRGGYLYHGRVKSLADGARKGGLKF
jgi:large subunit ribosomal protein L18